MNNKFFTSIAPIVAITMTGILAPSAQANILTVEQGTYIETNGAYCTIGYVNPTNNTALTAGHCNFIEDGETIPTQPFMNTEKDAVYTTKGTKIGKIVKNTYTAHSDIYTGKDAAIIQLEPWVKVGTNKYTTDKWADLNEIQKDDTICAYGGRTNKVRCGKVTEVNVDNNLINGDSTSVGLIGDSGGPAWVEGKGFVGVYSYSSSKETPEEKRITGFNYPEHYKEEMTTQFDNSSPAQDTSELSSIITNNKRVPATAKIIAIMLSIFFATKEFIKIINPYIAQLVK